VSLFNLKPDPVVGIDISSTAVKVIELSRAGKGYRVESYALGALPEKAVVDKNIAEVEIVGEVVTRSIQLAKPKAKYAAVAVAGPGVIDKRITLDGGLSDEDMRSTIQIDGESYLGMPVDEVNLDFLVLGPNEKEVERSDVLLVAARKEMVESRVTVVEMSNLKTRVVDVEKYALENAFVMMTQSDPEIIEGETVALVEVGATTTTMYVMGSTKTPNAHIVFSREEMFGGNRLTESIQAMYSMSYEESNYAKKNGGLPDGYDTDVLEPFKMDMAQQINRMVQFYYSTSSFGKLSHIMVAGGCASIDGVIEHIASKVGGHVTIANPFASMSIDSKINKKALMEDAPALMIACGLALRTFDEYPY
jgi:type IV pilus assembly protein PilM